MWGPNTQSLLTPEMNITKKITVEEASEDKFARLQEF